MALWRARNTAPRRCRFWMPVAAAEKAPAASWQSARSFPEAAVARTKLLFFPLPPATHAGYGSCPAGFTGAAEKRVAVENQVPAVLYWNLRCAVATSSTSNTGSGRWPKWHEREFKPHADRSGVEPEVTGFYDPATFSIEYVIADPVTRRCAVVDPILDFDPKSGSTGTVSADRLLKHIQRNGLTLDWILDTHPHADHFSAAAYLKKETSARTAIGERVTDVQKPWKKLYNLP